MGDNKNINIRKRHAEKVFRKLNIDPRKNCLMDVKKAIFKLYGKFDPEITVPDPRKKLAEQTPNNAYGIKITTKEMREFMELFNLYEEDWFQDIGRRIVDEILSKEAMPINDKVDDELISSFFREGEKYISELSQRKRDRALVGHRLQLDEYKCQNCGFPALAIAAISIESVLVEVHHIYPIQDGERETKIEDLITLCPNCHRLIHAIGKEVGSNTLSLKLLKKYFPNHGLNSC